MLFTVGDIFNDGMDTGFVALVLKDGGKVVADVHGGSPQEARRLAEAVARALDGDDEHAVRRTLSEMARAVRDGKDLVPSEPLDARMDADAVAVFVARQLRKAGLRYRLVAASQADGRPYHHVYVEVWYPDGDAWLPLDPLASVRYWARRISGEVENGAETRV